MGKVDEDTYFRYVSPFRKWDESHINSPGYSSAGLSNSRLPLEGFYYVGDWGPCSATCGRGIETRSVECVYIQAYTAKRVPLPEYECRGQVKQNSYRECYAKPCPSQETAAQPALSNYFREKDQRFRWDYGEWSPCSASCLGGKQHSKLRCVDIARNIPVGWSFCDSRQRPVDVRSCNTHPCPPSWEVGQFSRCTKSCGGGIRNRRVRCVRALIQANGMKSIIPVNESLCRGLKPFSKERCAVVDCPPKWKVQNWFPCSVTCGEGVKTRAVTCVQENAVGKIVVLNSTNLCRLEKPANYKVCNLGNCPSDGYFSDRAQQSGEKLFFDQAEDTGVISMKLPQGGIIFEGTDIKVECPLRKFPRNKIRWFKNGEQIISNYSDRVRISPHGRLRIFNSSYSDEGVYTCAGRKPVEGNTTLKIKPSLRRRISKTSKSKIKSSLQLPSQQKLGGTEEFYMKPRFAKKSEVQELLEQSNDDKDRKTLERLYKVEDNIEFLIKFVTGDWSACSQPKCGKNGLQQRHLECRITSDEYRASVSDYICKNFGLPKPPVQKRCRAMHCPKWKASAWSECSVSRCIEYRVSVQKRTIKCVDSNGTEVNSSLCDKRTRPKLKMKCFNANCVAKWLPTQWGPCTRTCGDGGIQLRVLHCVWSATGKPAKNCNSAEQPKVVRRCITDEQLQQCHRVTPIKDTAMSSNRHCVDKFRYCDIIKIFQRCDTKLMEKCCYSCNYYRYNAPAIQETRPEYGQLKMQFALS